MICKVLILVASVVLLACAERPSEMICEPESAMVAGIPGTDWVGCDGTCKFIDNDGNSTFECVKDQCPKECSCRVFSRPRKNWNGDWEDEGEWKEPTPREKDANKHYRCWCVKPAP